MAVKDFHMAGYRPELGAEKVTIANIDPIE